jgi:hypothetical protein
MPTLPWLGVTKNLFQRAQQVVDRGKPLTQSYPVGTFTITARNGGVLAPGQPAGMTRFSNGQSAGDPRAGGSYFNIKASTTLQSLLTGTPLSVTGGSVNNTAAAPTDNTFLWVGIAGVIDAFLFWDK